MASQGESKLPLPSAGAKEKRRSHLPSPRTFRKVTTAGKPLTPDPPRRHGTPERKQHLAASMSTELSPESPYRLGERVCIAGVKPGILRYYGRTQFAEGEWCGIELDDQEGKHNGIVDGIPYFSCSEGHGIFAPSFKVQPLNQWVLPERPTKLQQPKPSGIPGIPKSRASRSKSPEDLCTEEKILKRSLGELASGDSSSLPQSPRFISKLARPKSIGCDPRIQQRQSFPRGEGEDSPRASIERPPSQADKSPSLRPGKLPKPTPSSGLPLKRSHSALEQLDVKKSHSGIPKPGHKKESSASASKSLARPSGENLLTQSEYNEGTRNVSRTERAAKARSLSYDLTAEGQLPFGLGFAAKDTALRSSSGSLCSRSSSGSLISPKPDKDGRTLVRHKKTPLVFGGEAMSEPEDDSELLGGHNKLSHASSLGILPDSVLCNNSLVADEPRGLIDLKTESKDSTEMMEKDLDLEISGISTPEIDMSGSTISGKDLCSSPELEGKRDLNNYETDSRDAKAGELPVSPGSSEPSPNSEIEVKSKQGEHELYEGGHDHAKSEDHLPQVGIGKQPQHSSLDDLEQYPSVIRTSIDLEDLDASSMTASVEIAKTAVQQYAELMAAAEKERRVSIKHREARKAARREAERARSIDSDDEAFAAIKPPDSSSDRQATDTERSQLLVDLQDGHTKRDRPISMISVGSADTGIVADFPATSNKTERPLSLISTSSVDTGYQPDTDSEIGGTLTMNSPLGEESFTSANDNNNQVEDEELSPRSEALSLDAAYKDTFSRFQKVVQKGTMRENEIGQEMYSNTGTQVGRNEEQGREADTDIQDLIIQNTLLEYGLEEMLQSVPCNRAAHNGSPVENAQEDEEADSPEYSQDSPDGSTEEDDLGLYDGTHTPLSDVHVPMETIPEQDTPESPEVDFPGQKEASITNNDTTSTVSVTSDTEIETDLVDEVNNTKDTTPLPLDNAPVEKVEEALDNATGSALMDLSCNNPPSTYSPDSPSQDVADKGITPSDLSTTGISLVDVDVEVNENEVVPITNTLSQLEDAPISSSKDQVALFETLDNYDNMLSKLGPIPAESEILVNRVDAINRICVQGLPPPEEPETHMVLSSQEESGMSELESPSSPVHEVNKNLQETPQPMEEMVEALVATMSEDDKGLCNVPVDDSRPDNQQRKEERQVVHEELIKPTVAEAVDACLPSSITVMPALDDSLIQPSAAKDQEEEPLALTELMVEQLIVPGLSEAVMEDTTKEKEEGIITESELIHEPLKEAASVAADKTLEESAGVERTEAPSLGNDENVLEEKYSIETTPAESEPEKREIVEEKEVLQDVQLHKTEWENVGIDQEKKIAEPGSVVPCTEETPQTASVATDETPEESTEVERTEAPSLGNGENVLEEKYSIETTPAEQMIKPVESNTLDREPPKQIVVEEVIVPSTSQVLDRAFVQQSYGDAFDTSREIIGNVLPQPKSHILPQEPEDVKPSSALDKMPIQDESLNRNIEQKNQLSEGNQDESLNRNIEQKNELSEEKQDESLNRNIEQKNELSEEKQEEASADNTDSLPKADMESPKEALPQMNEKEEADIKPSEEGERTTLEMNDEASQSTQETDRENAPYVALNLVKENTFTIEEDKDFAQENVDKDKTGPTVTDDENKSKEEGNAEEDGLAQTLVFSDGTAVRTSTPTMEMTEEEGDSVNVTGGTGDTTSENINETLDTDTEGNAEVVSQDAAPVPESTDTTFSEGDQIPLVEIEIVSEMSESTIKDQGPTEKELLEKEKSEQKALLEKEKAGESSGDEKKKKTGVSKVTKGKRIEDVNKADEKKPTRTVKSTLTTRTKTTTSTKSGTSKDADKPPAKNRTTTKTSTLKPTSTLRKTETDKKPSTPKVSPRISDLNRKPAPRKASDNTIVVNNVKTAKNNTNLKKADSSAVKGVEKKTSTTPTPSIKRNPPPKSKWGNIMSQIDGPKSTTAKRIPPTKTTDVKTRTKPTGTTTTSDKASSSSKTTKSSTTTTTARGSSSTATTQRSPRDSAATTARTSLTTRRTSSANAADPKTKTSISLKATNSRPSSVGGARAKQSPEVSPRPDSRMSTASEASGRATSRAGSLAGSRPTSAGKPENRKTASLRRDKSPSVCSESSTSSQISTQSSRTARTRAKSGEGVQKVEPGKTRSTLAPGKRRADSSTGTDIRRSSLASSTRQAGKKDSSPVPTSDKKASIYQFNVQRGGYDRGSSGSDYCGRPQGSIDLAGPSFDVRTKYNGIGPGQYLSRSQVNLSSHPQNGLSGSQVSLPTYTKPSGFTAGVGQGRLQHPSPASTCALNKSSEMEGAVRRNGQSQKVLKGMNNNVFSYSKHIQSNKDMKMQVKRPNNGGGHVGPVVATHMNGKIPEGANKVKSESLLPSPRARSTPNTSSIKQSVTGQKQDLSSKSSSGKQDPSQVNKNAKQGTSSIPNPFMRKGLTKKPRPMSSPCLKQELDREAAKAAEGRRPSISGVSPTSTGEKTLTKESKPQGIKTFFLRQGFFRSSKSNSKQDKNSQAKVDVSSKNVSKVPSHNKSDASVTVDNSHIPFSSPKPEPMQRSIPLRQGFIRRPRPKSSPGPIQESKSADLGTGSSKNAQGPRRDLTVGRSATLQPPRRRPGSLVGRGGEGFYEKLGPLPSPILEVNINEPGMFQGQESYAHATVYDPSVKHNTSGIPQNKYTSTNIKTNTSKSKMGIKHIQDSDAKSEAKAKQESSAMSVYAPRQAPFPVPRLGTKVRPRKFAMTVPKEHSLPTSGPPRKDAVPNMDCGINAVDYDSRQDAGGAAGAGGRSGNPSVVIQSIVEDSPPPPPPMSPGLNKCFNSLEAIFEQMDVDKGSCKKKTPEKYSRKASVPEPLQPCSFMFPGPPMEQASSSVAGGGETCADYVEISPELLVYLKSTVNANRAKRDSTASSKNEHVSSSSEFDSEINSVLRQDFTSLDSGLGTSPDSMSKNEFDYREVAELLPVSQSTPINAPLQSVQPERSNREIVSVLAPTAEKCDNPMMHSNLEPQSQFKAVQQVSNGAKYEVGIGNEYVSEITFYDLASEEQQQCHSENKTEEKSLEIQQKLSSQKEKPVIPKKPSKEICMTKAGYCLGLLQQEEQCSTTGTVNDAESAIKQANAGQHTSGDDPKPCLPDPLSAIPAPAILSPNPGEKGEGATGGGGCESLEIDTNVGLEGIQGRTITVRRPRSLHNRNNRKFVIQELDEEEDDQSRNKATKSSTTSSTKRPPNQPDVVTNSVEPPAASEEIARLEALCEARTKQLNVARIQLKASASGFDAMTVLVKYLTEELDAFSCPEVTAKLKSVKSQLGDAEQQIALLKADKESLEKELCELRQQHVTDLQRLKDSHQEALVQLEQRLQAAKEKEIENVVEKYSHEVATLKSFLEKNISDLKAKHEKSLQDKEAQHTDHIEQIKQDHDLRIKDLQKQHEKRMEEITKTFENIKFTLSDKVEALRGECEEMRSREAQLQERAQHEADLKIHMALAKYQHLPAEIESLRAVMDMRNQELHELRSKKLDLEKQLEELPRARDKIVSLQQKVENLEAVIEIKGDYEKQLAEKHQILLRKFERESKANKRLSMDNEELAWRLQNSADSPDLLRRSISHSPTRTSAEPTPEVVRRRKSPACSIPTSPRNQTEFEQSPVTPQSPPKSNLKRSGTYDLLNKDLDEKDMKQSDV